MRRYKGKMIAGGLAVILLALCAMGCAKESSDSEKSISADSDKIQIGMSFDSFLGGIITCPF